MAKIRGRFYFQKTDNGNLLGEFSNNHDVEVFTESCDLIPNTSNEDTFAGRYHSTWQEARQPFFADLEISPNGKLFKLEWDRAGTRIFEGEAMLCNGLLVGNYWEH